MSYSAACCSIPPVISKGYSEKGTYENIGGLKTYVTGPPSARNAIVVLYDIFGFQSQVLQGADILALSDKNNPYRVFMPDFFEGKAADISWYPPTTEKHRDALGNFFSNTGNPAKAAGRLPGIVEAVKKSNSSIENVFALGMCWGAKPVTLCSGENTGFKAIVLAHPAMLDPEDATKVAVPTCVLASQDEDAATVSAFQANLRVPNHVHSFNDQVHGWMAARGDLEDPNVREKYRHGYQMLLDFFSRHLTSQVGNAEPTYLVALWSLKSPKAGADIVEFVKTIPAKAKKDGESYILEAHAGATKPPFPVRPHRGHGFNVTMFLKFKSPGDVFYWSSKDPLHHELIAFAKDQTYKDPVLTVFTDSDTGIRPPSDVGASEWQGPWIS
ncbi:dienelactone hydrolase family protein [Colletotrichum karsti]|uniref:Dienelactone hydrolase family protein n=1 Tax=Colletotrichum karsti TaxID=1095194 RepID=A0A9P6I0F8_9PEZI|nr:dienelactone hydrolase family protein [Colletotrichum karsti]KAF9874677.1 dienelactone hydrolase family protein [Colletotrichum karsti]